MAFTMFETEEDKAALKVGLKIGIFGEKGSGKSVFGLRFPKVAAIDTEGKLGHYRRHPEFGKNLAGIEQVRNYKDVSDAIDEAMDLYEAGAIENLVIDSWTEAYATLSSAVTEFSEKKARALGKSEFDIDADKLQAFGKIKTHAARVMGSMIDLGNMGCNVICIMQEKEDRKMVGNKMVEVGIGVKADAQKNVGFIFDVELRFLPREIDEHGKRIYRFEVLRDNTCTFEEGQIVNFPTYENTFKNYIEGMNDYDAVETKMGTAIDDAMESHKDDEESSKPASIRFKEFVMANPSLQQKALELMTAQNINFNALTKLDEPKLETILKELKSMK